MKQVLVIFLALFVCNASAQFWRTCHNGGRLPTSVSSALCTDTSCSFTRGSPLTASIGFTPTAAYSGMEVHITFFDGTVYQPIPITPPANEACPGMTSAGGTGCPLSANTATTYNMAIPIPAGVPTIPQTNFEVWVSSLSPSITEVWCFQVTGSLA